MSGGAFCLFSQLIKVSVPILDGAICVYCSAPAQSEYHLLTRLK